MKCHLIATFGKRVRALSVCRGGIWCVIGVGDFEGFNLGIWVHLEIWVDL